MKEIWKFLPEYNEIYMISNFGRIKNNKTNYIMILKPDKFGYIRKRIRNKCYLVHRLVAKAFIPNIYNKKEVNHINGIKSDNRVENLEWSTARENILHAYKTGLNEGSRKASSLRTRGENHRNSKLKEADVLNIRKLRKMGEKVTNLANKYNICTSTVTEICNRKLWKHI